MESELIVPDGSNEKCEWEYNNTEEVSGELFEEAISMLNAVEQDAKQKIDDELLCLRDRLHLILNEQRRNCQYVFGIDAERFAAAEEQVVSSYGYSDASYGHFNQQEPNESGIASLESDGTTCDAECYSDEKSLSGIPDNRTCEEIKDASVIKIMSATLRIHNALHR